MKEKTSITLSGDVLAAIDRIAGSKQSRSAFIERVLREFLRERARAAVQARDLERINAAAQRLNAEASDVMDLPLSDSDRRLLASTLLKDAEELTADRVEGAIRALRRIHLRRRLDQVQREIQACKDPPQLAALLQERVRLKQALLDPGLADDGPHRRTGS